MKQHPGSVNRDLDDEVAETIEHQYAQRMVKPVRRGDGESPTRPAGAAQDSSEAEADQQHTETTDDQRKTRGS